jgi:hypothetical protein
MVPPMYCEHAISSFDVILDISHKKINVDQQRKIVTSAASHTLSVVDKIWISSELYDSEKKVKNYLKEDRHFFNILVIIIY